MMKEFKEHTDKHYEADLKDLKEDILRMGAVVEEMLVFSMKSLVDRNSAFAEEVIKKEPVVNQLEMMVDDRCLKLLALHQPAAVDLRFIVISLKIGKDLERMGDLAVNIAEIAIELNQEPQLKQYVDLPRLSAIAQHMVNRALDAFVKQDAILAKKVLEQDDEADNLKDKIQDDLVPMMEKDKEAVFRAVRLILIARQLERIADHATNIAEEVVFMVQGKDIRHQYSRSGSG